MSIWRLSVNIITRDGVTEPSNVRRAIESIADVAGEIVVVDTGSSDTTLGELTALRSRIRPYLQLTSHQWRFNFAEARNRALLLSHGAWILWVDSDETVPEETVQFVREAVNGPPAGYIMTQVSPHDLRAPQLRLFPNARGLTWYGRVHEQIAPSLRWHGFPIIETSAEIDHHKWFTQDEVQASLDRNNSIIRNAQRSGAKE